VFTGLCFLAEIAPKIAAFMAQNGEQAEGQRPPKLGNLIVGDAQPIEVEPDATMALVAS
jgi:hypothetical protein